MAKSGSGSDYDFLFKLILIGDAAVGKTNLLLRLTRNEFRLGTQSTIGVEFAYKQITIDRKKIKTQVWDTAGQERFKTVVPQLYRGSEGVFAVFDLTKPDTFTNISKWIEEVHRHTPSDIPIILIGNKSDLIDQRKISREQATDLAQRLHLFYMETSALNATNVEQAYIALVTNIYQKKKTQLIDNPSSIISTQHEPTNTIPISDPTITITSNPIHLDNSKSTETKSSGGCCKSS